MHLTLKRTTFTSASTIGSLSIDGQFECYVLEDVVRKPGEAKVFGKTAIPAGTYPVAITFSSRFQRPMPLLGNVPGYAGIRIHSGNTAADTEGCLLVGTSKDKDFIGGSRDAYAKLYPKIKAAIDLGNPVTISIS